MCRFFRTRLLSSWRNTLYCLFLAFPSFPVLLLVSAKGCVQLKTRSKYKLLCHKALIFWKPGQDLAPISMWSRYLKLSYPLQSPYTAQIIQLDKDRCLLWETCSVVWTPSPGFPLTEWEQRHLWYLSSQSWTIFSLSYFGFRIHWFLLEEPEVAGGSGCGWTGKINPYFRCMRADVQKICRWACNFVCLASLHCKVEEFKRPLFQHASWNGPVGWVSVQSPSGPYRNQWLLSTLEIGLIIWTINWTELVGIPGPRYECWKWGLGLTDHDLQSCWALWVLWQDTGAQCFWKHHVLS